MVGHALQNFGKAALDILYPPCCALCRRNGSFLCEGCLDRLPRAEGLRCDVCWQPLWSPDCRACAEHQPAFSALRSAFRYVDDVRNLVHAFKYNGQSSLAPELAACMLEAMRAAGLEADAVQHVPMTFLRKQQRGYNQSGLLATEIARALGLPRADALKRPGFKVASQARTTNAVVRRRNVVGAFGISRPERVEGRRVLLVDDVATTGATLDACARVLLDAGAADVVALTLARED